MIWKREFTKEVATYNKDITKEVYTERRYFLGFLYYEDHSDYSCEMTEHKTKIGLK